MKRKGGKVNLQLTAFVLSDSHVLGGGRPAGTHYTPLASPKAVTLTNSQGHNGTVVQFVFSLNALYAVDTKAAPARPFKYTTTADKHKASFLVFLKRKAQSCFFFFYFNPSSHHTGTFLVFWQGGVAGRYMMKMLKKSFNEGNKLQGWAGFLAVAALFACLLGMPALSLSFCYLAAVEAVGED